MQVITHNRHARNISDLERTASVVAGGWLALQGLRRRGRAGYWMTLSGAELVRRGATGRCFAYDLFGVSTAPAPPNASLPPRRGVCVDGSVTVNRPVEDVYRFWRNFENLPRFMQHLESVTVLDDKKTKWVVRAPRGNTVEWEAIIINQVENAEIAWRALEGSEVENAGSVEFRPAPGERGTVVKVHLQYNPPAGIVGASFAAIIRQDLHRLQQVLEGGEIPTTEGQPRGMAASAGGSQMCRA